MSNSSIIADLKGAVSDVLSSVADVISLAGPTRNFNDFNKKSKERELGIYCLASSNIPSEMYGRITSGVEEKLIQSIRMILNTTIAADPMAAFNFVQNNFTNGKDLITQVRSMADGLSEASGVSFDELQISFNTPLTEKKNDRPAKPLVDIGSTGNKTEKEQKEFLKRAGIQHATFDLSKNSDMMPQDRAAIKTKVNVYSFDITYIAPPSGAGGKDAHGVTLKVSIAVHTRIIPVDTEVLLGAMSSAKNRGIFANYISMRAGASSFWKGFVLNLKEIQRQVSRDTSKNMTERIIGSLLSKTGFTRPKFIGEISELKNYVLVITADDSDRLTREFGTNLTKPGDLKKVFDNMNILTLIIIDEAKGRAIFFESDNPTEMTIISIRDLNDASRLANIFSAIGRN